MKEEDKTLEYEAGSVLVNDGIRFRIPFFFGIKLPLTIFPLNAETIVRISMQVSKLKKIRESDNAIASGLGAGTNYLIFSRIIAMAAINSRVPGVLLTGLLSRKIRKLQPKEILTYCSIAYRQMDHQRFFFIMLTTLGMNYLEKKIEPGKSVEDDHSGEPLQSFKKPLG